MTPKEFNEAVVVVGELFTPLSASARSFLYDEFANVPAAVFGRALQIVIRDHPYARFPLPREIWKAINEVVRSRKSAPLYEICLKCDGTGLVVVDKPDPDCPKRIYKTAVFCTCERGRTMKNAHSGPHRRRTIPGLSYPGQAGDEEEALFPAEWEHTRQPGEEG